MKRYNDPNGDPVYVDLKEVDMIDTVINADDENDRAAAVHLKSGNCAIVSVKAETAGRWSRFGMTWRRPMADQYTDIIIFDLDGVLASGTHREHLLQKTPKDWDGYFERCGEDEPIAWGITMLNMFMSRGHGVSIWTGRPERTRAKTLAWLDAPGRLTGVPNVRMRANDDYRPAAQVKHGWLLRMPVKPILAIEDTPAVVEMWRTNGVPVLEVERRYDLQRRQSVWPP